jgi:hypothetical protein
MEMAYKNVRQATSKDPPPGVSTAGLTSTSQAVVTQILSFRVASTLGLRLIRVVSRSRQHARLGHV